MSNWEIVEALINILIEKNIIALEEFESMVDRLRRVRLSDVLSPEELSAVRESLERYALKLEEDVKSRRVEGWASAMYWHSIMETLKQVRKILEDLENLPRSMFSLLKDFLEKCGYEDERVFRKLTLVIPAKR